MAYYRAINILKIFNVLSSISIIIVIKKCRTQCHYENLFLNVNEYGKRD